MAPVVYSRSPLWRADARQIEVPEGCTVADIVERCEVPTCLRSMVEVEIAGHRILRERWRVVRPRAGRLVNVWIVPAGAGGGSESGGGGKQIGMGALFVVAAVVAIATGQAWLAGPLLSMGMGMIVSGVMTLLFPAPKPPKPPGEPSSAYYLATQTNTAQPYAPIPRIYGRHKIVPAHAAPPWVVTRGNRNDLRMLYCLGYGPLQVEDIRISDTPVDRFPGITIVEHPQFAYGNRHYTDTLSIYNRQAVQQGFNVELTPDWFVLATAENTTRVVIDISFPRGMVHIDSKGNYKSANKRFFIDWRVTGGSGWTPHTSLSWGASPNARADGSALMIEAGSTSPFTVSLEMTMPAADAYDFRVRRESPKSTDNQNVDDANLVMFTSEIASAPIAPRKPHHIIELLARSSEQLSGTLNRLTCIATAKLAIPDASGNWTVQATRNPAWAFLDVLRGTVALKPLPDNVIDLATIAEWAAYCDEVDPRTGAARHTCDFVLDYNATTWETLQGIASTGRAIPTYRDGMVSVAWDSPGASVVQVFTPRNSRSFSASRNYLDIPHCLNMRILDETGGWLENTIQVFDDGYNADGSGGMQEASQFEDVELFGITSPDRAWTMGRYQLAQTKLRPEEYSIETSLDHLCCTRGDLVELVSDVSMIGGEAVRIRDVVADGATVTVTIDTPLPIVAGHVIRWRDADLVLRTETIIDVTGPSTFTIEPAAAVTFGDLAVIGEMASVTRQCLVKSIIPTQDLSAAITLVDWAPAIYESDVEEIPDYDPGLTRLEWMPPEPATALTATQYIYYADRIPYAAVTLTWQPAENGVLPSAWTVWVRTDDGGWRLLTTTKELRHEHRADYAMLLRAVENEPVASRWVGATLTFAVAGVNAMGATLPLTAQSQISIVLTGDLISPPAPAKLHSNARGDTMLLSWDAVDVPDLDRYQLRYSPDPAATWDQMTILASNLPATQVMLEIPTRTGIYAIKSMDTSGNWSTDAATTAVSGYTPLPANVVAVVDAAADSWGGVKTTVEVVAGKLRLVPIGAAEFAPSGHIVAGMVNLGAFYSGVRMTSHIEGIGRTASGDPSPEWNAWFEFSSADLLPTLDTWLSLDDGAERIPYDWDYDTTIDGYLAGLWDDTAVDWSPWQRLVVGEIAGRIFRFRLVLAAGASSTITPEISAATVEIDMLDRDERANDISVPVNGLAVGFAHPFAAIPSMSVVLQDAAPGEYCHLSDVTRLGFSLDVRNASGTSVGGSVDWVARGYGRST